MSGSGRVLTRGARHNREVRAGCPAGTKHPSTKERQEKDAVRKIAEVLDLVGRGDSVSITFDKPGRYDYICTLHSKDMHGTVIVT